MPLEVDKKRLFLKIKEVWFADSPYEIKNCDLLIFIAAKREEDRTKFLRQKSATFVIDLTQGLDDLWMKMAKKSCRYSIKRAIREGMVVYRNREKDYRAFYDLCYFFSVDRGLPMPRVREIEIWRKYGILFTVEYRGEVIAGNLYFSDEKNIRWVIGVSRKPEDGVNRSTTGWASALLIWETINYAKKNGLTEFDLGGCYIGEDKNDHRYNIRLFKEKFGGALTYRYTYYRYSAFYSALKNIYYFIKGSHENS